MLGWLLGRRDEDEEYDDEFDDDGGWDGEADEELADVLDDVDSGPHVVDLDCDCEVCAERWRCCIHEAGHVVVFHAFDVPFNYVTIIPNPEKDEFHDTEGGSGGGYVSIDQKIESMRDPQELRAFMLIGAAGGRAEFAERGEIIGTISDDKMMNKLLGRKECPIDCDEADEIADVILDERWDDVISIAEDLFNNDTLSYTETV